jgi:hypothetical protein
VDDRYEIVLNVDYVQASSEQGLKIIDVTIMSYLSKEEQSKL